MGVFTISIILLANKSYSLNTIKSKTVGDGQHGTARFATNPEIKKAYKFVTYSPDKWRKKTDLPVHQGIIVGTKYIYGKLHAIVDTDDVHALMIGSAGVGKTANFLYPNLEYACASGMSFMTSDTKGDLFRNYGTIASRHYGYNVSVIDLRNPTRSNHFNMLHLVNKYMDIYLETKDIKMKAKAERYAKIISKTIIYAGSNEMNFGQNQFFYDSAEGLLTSTILIISEYAEKDKRHIISVFKLLQDLLEVPLGSKESEFKSLINKLPANHKARWFAGSALNTSDQSMQSILSTAMSRLNSFIDSELEQILCFGTDIDAEKFCNEKSALFVVLPEEDNTKYFIVSLIIQQLYREILMVAEETEGKLKNRVMFYLDEFGTIPKIESAEMMFSASRSRRLSLVAIIQSLAQLDKNYGKEGSEIIVDNCQLSIFGGFAPNSQTAEVLSKNLGSRTVLSGSVSKGKSDPSQSLQMIERPLMTSDELKSMPKGEFIVMKTGIHPMVTKLMLFFKWGISFEDTFIVPENTEQTINYVTKQEIFHAVTGFSFISYTSNSKNTLNKRKVKTS